MSATSIPAAAPVRSRGVWLLAAAVWIATIVAGGALLALHEGTLHWPDISTAGTAENLRHAIAARRAAIASAGCNPNGTATAVVTPPAPIAPPPAPPPANGDVPLTRAALVRHAEYGIVLVLTDDASGSGFFIAPDLIVTNRHVVEEQQDGEVAITSKALGHVIPGQVIATTAKGQPGSPDFALIRVPPQQAATPFALSPLIGKLESIVVGGYPGMVLAHDEGFKRLLINHDVTAAPDLNLNDGTVSAIEPSAQGVIQIVHSATVLKGNSGGPLIDRCARVVGINTFISVDSTQSGRVNYALSAGDLAKFLQSRGVNVPLHQTPCS